MLIIQHYHGINLSLIRTCEMPFNVILPYFIQQILFGLQIRHLISSIVLCALL